MRKNNRYGEKGNVLFLILIAVALFAALSYAVTQSSRSGGGDASKETNLVASGALTQYGAGVRQAVSRMMVSGEVTPDQLLFDIPENFSSLTADEIKRAVFHPQGGGAIYEEGWIVNAGFQITGVGLTDSGAPVAATDIVALKVVPVAVCRELNKKFGINISDADMNVNVDVLPEQFDDNMDSDHPGIHGGVNGYWGILGSTDYATQATYDGQHQGCYYNGASGVYQYYDVIVAR